MLIMQDIYLTFYSLMSAVVSVGFTRDTYSVAESDAATVCIELLYGSTNRPIDVLLYTNNGTALGRGLKYCSCISIHAVLMVLYCSCILHA